MTMETRKASPASVKGRTLTGRVAPYGVWADIGGFDEMIQRGAFDASVAAGQVSLWWQHGAGRDVLASQRAGTLALESRADGLYYTATLGDTPQDDLYLDRVGRGLVPEMSFGFDVPPNGDAWEIDAATKRDKRTLINVALWEISPVEIGAYPGTNASRRARKRIAMERNEGSDGGTGTVDLGDGIETLGLRECMARAGEIRSAMKGIEDAEERGALALALDECRERIASLSSEGARASGSPTFRTARASDLRGAAARASEERASAWMRGGGRAPFTLDLRSGLREYRATMGIAVSGGVNFGTAAVQPTLEADFIKSALGPTAMMRLARIQPCSGPYNKPKIGSRDDYTTGSVKAEGGAGTSRDFNATSLSFTPYAHAEMYEVSTELLEDSAYDVAAEIADEIGIGQGIWWDNQFINGSGSGAPEGALTATWSNTYTTAADNVLTVDDCLAAKYKLNPLYWTNGAYIMSAATWGALRREKTSGGAYLIDGQRDNAMVDGMRRPTLDGDPVYLCSAMPAVANAAYPVLYGDFKRAYEIALRRDLTIKRAAEDKTSLQSGLVNFVGNLRADGKARDLAAAIKVLVQ